MNQTRHQLSELIAQKTLDATDQKELAREIAAYLMHENKVDSLESLVRDVIQIRADHGLVEATAISSSPLTDMVMRDLESLLKQEYPNAKKVIVNQKVDEKVVGGIRIDMANEQLDMSVRAKLNKFKRLVSLERNNA